MKKFLKKILHPLEYGLFLIIIKTAPLLGIDRSSAFFGRFLRLAGPFFPFVRLARKNIKTILGEKVDCEKIIDEALDNFGRYIGEFPYVGIPLSKDVESRIEIEGEENIEKFRKENKPFLMVTGHFANWEIMIGILPKLYPKWALVYRKANNPYVDSAVKRMRESSLVRLIPKGAGGARDLLRYFQSGYSVVMLVDQKMNEGISVPFLGMKARSPSAPAKAALKFDYPIVPCFPIRKKGAYFKFKICEALKIFTRENERDKIYNLTKSINKALESQIIEDPGQWFWFHDKWSLRKKDET